MYTYCISASSMQSGALSHQKAALDSIKIWIARSRMDFRVRERERETEHYIYIIWWCAREHMRSNYTTACSWWWWDDALIFLLSSLKRIVHNDFIIYSRRHSLCQRSALWIMSMNLDVSQFYLAQTHKNERCSLCANVRNGPRATIRDGECKWLCLTQEHALCTIRAAQSK